VIGVGSVHRKRFSSRCSTPEWRVIGVAPLEAKQETHRLERAR